MKLLKWEQLVTASNPVKLEKTEINVLDQLMRKSYFDLSSKKKAIAEKLKKKEIINYFTALINPRVLNILPGNIKPEKSTKNDISNWETA